MSVSGTEKIKSRKPRKINQEKETKGQLSGIVNQRKHTGTGSLIRMLAQFQKPEPETRTRNQNQKPEPEPEGD